MNKPYIVCYMMTSVDGRIDCEMTGQLPGVQEYYEILDQLDIQSAVSGKITAKLELAEKGTFDSKETTSIGKEVVSKKMDSIHGYSIIMDTKGTLLWNEDSDYEQPHIIVTSELVSKEYLDYLDEKNISYIVTGKTTIDLTRACEILKGQFGIARMGVVGGAAINTAFLDADLLDEVIILIGAGIDGRASFPPVFNRVGSEECKVTPLQLMEVKSFHTGAVLLRYKTK